MYNKTGTFAQRLGMFRDQRCACWDEVIRKPLWQNPRAGNIGREGAACDMWRNGALGAPDVTQA